MNSTISRALTRPDLVQHIGAAVAERLAEEVDGLRRLPYIRPRRHLQASKHPSSSDRPNTFGVSYQTPSYVSPLAPARTRRRGERGKSSYEESFNRSTKIHANMDPNHRSCIAFVKVCSGRFERNVYYYHTRLDKQVRFSSLPPLY